MQDLGVEIWSLISFPSQSLSHFEWYKFSTSSLLSHQLGVDIKVNLILPVVAYTADVEWGAHKFREQADVILERSLSIFSLCLSIKYQNQSDYIIFWIKQRIGLGLIPMKRTCEQQPLLIALSLECDWHNHLCLWGIWLILWLWKN